MTTEAKPKTVQVGDPITVTNTISGRGNFDRVNAPVIEDERGWHKYPPSSKFKQDDEVGLSGTKTFEMVLSPNDKKQGLPLLAFSSFDPVKEQYVTLHSEPIPITVEGGTAVASSAGGAPPGSATPAHSSARGITGHDCKQTTGHSLSTDRATPDSRFLCADLYTKRFLGSAGVSFTRVNRICRLEDSPGEN